MPFLYFSTDYSSTTKPHQMGLSYNVYLNSDRIFGCKTCKTHLASHDAIMSRVCKPTYLPYPSSSPLPPPIPSPPPPLSPLPSPSPFHPPPLSKKHLILTLFLSLTNSPSAANTAKPTSSPPSSTSRRRKPWSAT